MFRSLCSDREDDLDSVTDHESSSDFEILCESYCQKWTEENWLASISKLTDGMFKISVSQRDELESELWEAERSMEDCVRLYHKLCQKYPDLEEFISKTPKDTPASADTQLSETITDPDTFIDHIVNLIKKDQNPEAAFFLSPFSYEEDKDLFDNILLEREASDESSLDDLCWSSDRVEYKSLNVESSQKDRKRTQSASEQNESTSNERLELDSGESDEFQEESKDIDPMTKGYDVTGSSLHPDDTNPHRHKQLETQMNKKKMEKAVLKALYNLADKLILGGKPVFRFAHLIGQMSTYNEKILQNIDHLFSEEHIVCYLNKISDLLESTEVPPPVQPESLKRQALELIEKQIQGKFC
ncbi:uncharacterized protein LOC128503845 [Spea bombifrons]|uniref:uncharacterized protein LOC128503845 n=1 Tax=Spea bombifrons TaxID=233779 RepID=UPI00234BD306|nr:uncharacterized protein LOC128503845 [Spea bombifrons]